MQNSNDYRASRATSNAGAPQKLEINGFSEETQVWAWKTFTHIAKNITKENHFCTDDATAMESLALTAILSDGTIMWDATHHLTREQYLAGIIARKLRQAAAKIADERSIWTESRTSLDTPCDTDADDASLGDLLMEGQNLNVNSKLFGKPRVLVIRNTIKRLKNTKNRTALANFRDSLNRDTVYGDDAETDDLPDNETEDPHVKAVAEVGYTKNEDDEVPQVTFRIRSSGFGNPFAANKLFGVKMDVRDIISTLPPQLRKLCRLMKNIENPETAYKIMNIDKNDYFKHIRPLLRHAFAELADVT